MTNTKILIVGAGLTGCTISRILADCGCECHIIDSRDHIAGNAFDFRNEFGIVQHRYGPHLFHTKNENVFKFLSRFTDWTPYKHKVKAMLENGTLVTLPPNRETARIVGEENIIETFFRPYSEKMWGMKLEEIDPSITSRVSSRSDDNEYYFPNDPIQCMPKDGFEALCKRMLDHENIKLELNREFMAHESHEFDHVFYSGPIDVFFKFKFGPLPYRSIKFNTVHMPFPKAFPVSVVNFTHSGKNTRVTEWKNIPGHGTNEGVTTLTFEEPCSYDENKNERYYPVKDNTGEINELFMKYKKEASQLPNISFCGRLGQYAYLNMDQAVNSAMKLAEKFIKQNDQQ